MPAITTHSARRPASDHRRKGRPGACEGPGEIPGNAVKVLGASASMRQFTYCRHYRAGRGRGRDRQARNFLEHIDERLDLWAAPPRPFAPPLETVFDDRADALCLEEGLSLIH